jgi:hypothetical protein
VRGRRGCSARNCKNFKPNCLNDQTLGSLHEPVKRHDQRPKFFDQQITRKTAMKRILITMTILAAAIGQTVSAQTYLGNLSANPYLPKALPQPPNTFNNPYGSSADSPKLYDSQGNFHGNLNANKYDPDSVANPYGRYGSQYSPDSINNPYGAGSRYNPDSPNNPYGNGMKIIGR